MKMGKLPYATASGLAGLNQPTAWRVILRCRARPGTRPEIHGPAAKITFVGRGRNSDAGRRRPYPRCGRNDTVLRSFAEGADRLLGHQNPPAFLHHDVPVV